MVDRSSSRASSHMSPLTRSKPESPSSPATGDVSERPASKPTGDRFEVELEHSRQRKIGWAIGGPVLGLLLILKFGTVGVWAGWVLVAYGLIRAAQVVQTFRYPAGSIVVA